MRVGRRTVPRTRELGCDIVPYACRINAGYSGKWNTGGRTSEASCGEYVVSARLRT